MRLLFLLFSFFCFHLVHGQNSGYYPKDFNQNRSSEIFPVIDGENTDSMDIHVYIPDIFSPNGDGVNDLFQITTATENNLLITRFYIFDRWGYKVYERLDLPIHSTEGWWDGTMKRFTINSGVFAYYIELQYPNGERKTFKGDVTLIR